MTTLAILLYLAVGYFVDRFLMEVLESADEMASEDGVVGMRVCNQFLWPLALVCHCYLAILYVLYRAVRTCWAVLCPTTRSNPSEADEAA